MCIYTHIYMYIYICIYIYTHTTSSLSIHLLMDIWALSILWLFDSAAINIGVRVPLPKQHTCIPWINT